MSQTAATHRGKIVTIGDLLVDVWWRVAPAPRNVEHAAVPLISAPQDCKIRPGGAGLFAHTAALAGFDVTLFSVADTALATARMLTKLSRTVDTTRVHILETFSTPIKTRYVNENGHILVRHDAETAEQPAHDEPNNGALRAEIQSACCVVISDYSKKCIASQPVFEKRSHIVAAAKDSNCPVFVDAKPQYLPAYKNADLFKLNRAELDGLLGKQENLEIAIRSAAAILQPKLLLVTDGSRGVGWWLRGQQGFFATPKKYSAGNCVGAGDTFFAGLLLGFSEVKNFDCATLTVEQLLAALRIAAIAAGQRIRANGAKPFNPQKILREANRVPETAQKIVPISDIFDIVNRARARKKQIVLANGCFDLLHAGHLQLLNFAKQQGDFLLVGLDSDANVRKLKGAGRPINDEHTRAQNLAALSVVDAVCIFDDTADNPLTSLRGLIFKTMPNVLVKGADYDGKKIVGDDLMALWRGRIALCPRWLNVSTTALVEKIRMTE